MPYRNSNYIDFNTGKVLLAPMALLAQKSSPLTLDDKIDVFECRVEVWQLGVAVAVLTAIEANQQPSIWSHAAYGLLSCAISYFEMIGKTLNPTSRTAGTANIDFNYGFCDVYPPFAMANQSRSYQDKDVPNVQQFRNRLRNGLYHLAYTKNHLWIHNDTSLTLDDFFVTPNSPPEYLVNPHRMVHTLVDHFPSIISRIRDTNNAQLRGGFVKFFDEYHK